MRNTGLIILSFILAISGAAFAEPTKAVQSGSPAGDYVSGEGEILIKKLKEEAKQAEVKKRKKDEPAYFDLSKEDAEMAGSNKVMQGTVSGIGPGGIAVEYAVDEKGTGSNEKWFNFVKGVNFNGFKKYTDLGLGDKVSVVYKESNDGKKRILKGVTLVQKKPKPTAEELAAEAAAAAKAKAEAEAEDITPEGGSTT